MRRATLVSVPLMLLCPRLLAAQAVPDETPVRAEHAMVVSVHHLAADAGVEIMKEGGNAVDAAVATGFALAVVHPVAGNIGGGGFMLIRLKPAAGAKSGKATFIDYREEAPQAASANMYLDGKGDVVPNASIVGYKAIGVPGSVAGMAYAEKKYGKLTLAKVMAPAIRLATDGFSLTDEEAQELHDPHLAEYPESKRIFTRDGNFYKTGEVFRQPDLARTLTRIAAVPSDFYHGALAKELAAAMQKGGGLITEADLAGYEVHERDPLIGHYEKYTVLSAPPPSSGGVTMIEALNILSGYNLARLGDRTPSEMHLIAEAYRRAYMDRNDYLGDPAYVEMPVAQMIDPKYADAWRRGITQDATPTASLKRPEGFLPPPPTMADLLNGKPESFQTTHYSVVDPQGNAVAVTTTLNGGFGSYVTADGLGFLLNDEMDDFASKLGSPNMFGLIQGPANSIAPGKRPLSSMTPTIVLEDNKVRFVLGSPGGARIISTVANIFLSATDGGLNIQAAVDAPRFHEQALPDTLYLEPGFPDTTIEGLRALGYKLTLSEHHWSDGECIAVDPKSGMLEGGQDHRHHFGKAAGY